MWPGDTADVTSLIPVVDRLRRRFAIGIASTTSRENSLPTPALAVLVHGGHGQRVEIAQNLGP
jgi:hypothetical protein